MLGALGIKSQHGGLQAREAFAQVGVGLAGGCPADGFAKTVWRKFHDRAQRSIAGHLDQLQPDRGIVLAQFFTSVGDAPLADDRQCFLPQIASLLIAVARVEQRAPQEFIRRAADFFRPEGKLVAALIAPYLLNSLEVKRDRLGHGGRIPAWETNHHTPTPVLEMRPEMTHFKCCDASASLHYRDPIHIFGTSWNGGN